MKNITPRGWLVIWILALVTLFTISSALGVWDISEICLVDGADCPEGWNG